VDRELALRLAEHGDSTVPWTRPVWATHHLFASAPRAREELRAALAALDAIERRGGDTGPLFLPNTAVVPVLLVDRA
jgi:hypothetical protein